MNRLDHPVIRGYSVAELRCMLRDPTFVVGRSVALGLLAEWRQAKRAARRGKAVPA